MPSRGCGHPQESRMPGAVPSAATTEEHEQLAAMRAPGCQDSQRRALDPSRTGEKQNGEGRRGLPRFCGELTKARRKKLEREPQTKLHLAGVVPLNVNNAEG